MYNLPMNTQTTLFRTVFGSKLYGTATPSSDSDYKEIVLPSMRSLLLGHKLVNVVKQTAPGRGANDASDVDTEYIPVQVFARDFLGGQTYAIELAFAVSSNQFNPEQSGTSLSNTRLFSAFVDELTTKFLTSNMKALVGYTQNQIYLLGNKGTQVTALTDLQSLLQATPDLRLHSIADLVSRWDYQALAVKYPTLYGSSLLQADPINGVVQQKFLSVFGKSLAENMKLSELLQLTQNRLSKYGARSHTASASDNVDWKGVAHGMRIVDQGLELLTTGKLSFPVSNQQRELLLDIRAGKFPIDGVMRTIEDKLNLLSELQKTSTLPVTIDLATFEDWLSTWVMRFYKIQ